MHGPQNIKNNTWLWLMVFTLYFDISHLKRPHNYYYTCWA